MSGLFEIGVVQDNCGRLATKLHENRLAMTGTHFPDDSTDRSTANKLNLTNRRMSYERLSNQSCTLSFRLDHIEDSSRKPSFSPCLAEKVMRPRTKLRCFEHNRAANGNWCCDCTGCKNDTRIPSSGSQCVPFIIFADNLRSNGEDGSDGLSKDQGQLICV